MEIISNGKMVEVAYKFFAVDGDTDTTIYEFTKERPDRFIFGYDHFMLDAFLKNLEGLKAGDEFDFTLAPEDAYGEYSADHILELEKSIFFVNGEFDEELVHVGAIVPMNTTDGYRIDGLVKEITDNSVIMDFNHKLAGKNVRFVGSVVSVRKATEEEKHPQHGCGGCHKEGGCHEGGCCEEGHHDGECCGKGEGHHHGDGGCCGKGEGHHHGDGGCCHKGEN